MDSLGRELLVNKKTNDSKLECVRMATLKWLFQLTDITNTWFFFHVTVVLKLNMKNIWS